MPITTSAKKALRGSLIKKAANDRNKKAVKESTKTLTRSKLVKPKIAKLIIETAAEESHLFLQKLNQPDLITRDNVDNII